MLKTTYKKRSILIALLISFVFTFNLFAQSAQQKAANFKQEGDNYYSKGEFKSAITSYLKAIEADPNYLNSYPAIADAYSRSHEHKLASAFYALYLKKVAETKTENITPITTVFYVIGNELRLTKEFQLSNEAFDLALQSTIRFIQDYESVSSIYSYRGDLNSAVKYQIAAINFSNSDDDSGRYISLSWYYSFLQKHQESVDAATKSIAINSNQAMAYTNRCRAYNDLKQYDKAIADCQKALSLQPDHGETQYYLATSYRRKGNTTEANRLNKLALPNLYKEAEAAYNAEVISLPDYFFILGNALFENEDFAKAVKAYQAGLEFKPNFPSLRFNLGLAYLQTRNKEGAMEQYRELLSIDSNKARVLKEQIDAEE